MSQYFQYNIKYERETHDQRLQCIGLYHKAYDASKKVWDDKEIKHIDDNRTNDIS